MPPSSSIGEWHTRPARARRAAQEPGLSEARYARLKQALLPLLLEHQGHANPVRGRDCARAVGQKHDRLVRKAFRRMLGEGWLVLSSTREPAGFFIAQSMEEVEAYLRTMDSRIREDLAHRRAVKRLAARKFGRVCQLALPLPAQTKIAPDV